MKFPHWHLCVLAFMLSTLLAPAVAPAATYYVASTGADSNPGTSASPWRTLQKAADTVQAGDVVNVSPGTYAGFQVTTSGTSASRIVFRASGSGVLVNQPNSKTPDNINVEAASYVTIEGFTVEDAPRVGIRMVLATGGVIRNNVVRRSGLTGILTGWTPAVLIEGNVTSGSLQQHGIYVSNSNTPNDNPVVRGNESFGNNENGIQFNGDCWEGGDGVIEGALIENNIVHDNNWKGFSIISVQASIIQNNVIYDNGISAGAGGLHLTDQVGPSCGKPSSNNLVVNNTIVEPRIACIRMTDGSTANIVFNNLCVSPSSARLILDDVGGNLIDAVSNLKLTSSSGLFVDAAGKNFHLASASGAIDAGIALYQGRSAPVVDRDGNKRPAGQRHDAGAFEAGGSAPPTDVVPPTVSLTAPAPNATIETTTTVTASASDNIAVTSVEFLLDGVPLGAADTQAPYSISLDPNAHPTGFYTLSARARDSAGNIASSPGITVFLRNNAPGGIPTAHPRLYNIGSRLSLLKAKACRDANGNVIPNCTPTADWNDFLAKNITSGAGEAWTFALAYMVTGNASYATQAIQKVRANIADGLGQRGAAERQDYFLNGHYYIRNAAVVYDWLNNLLTPADKASFVNYMNQMLYEIWNPTTNPCKTSSGWGQNDPKNNYYYRHVLGTALVAIATYQENNGMVTFQDCDGVGGTLPLKMPFNGVDYGDPLEFTYVKINNQAIPYILSDEAGGGWHEGTNYGRASKILMFEVFTVLRDGGGTNYFSAITFPRESALFHMYCLQPDNVYHYTNGDAPRDPLERANDSDVHLMLLLMDGLSGMRESAYARFWLDTFGPPVEERIKAAWFYLFYNPAAPRVDYRAELPTRYYASGMSYVNSRSSWSADAVSVNFLSAERIVDHMHRNQNEFAIFYKGWQTVNGNTYLKTGLVQETQYHNTIMINHESQRYGRGTGDIIRYEATPGYTYVVGDASDAYYSNASPWGSGDQKMIDVFQRELVHILPDLVVVFDRVTPTPAFQDREVTYVVNAKNQPAISGRKVTLTNGSGRLIQQTVLPATTQLVPLQRVDGSFSTWRVEESAPIAANYQFLHVLYATESTVADLPPVAAVNVTSGNMVGVQIGGGAEDKVLLFSADPSGAAPGGQIRLQVGMGESGFMLYDLRPDTGYAIEVTESEGQRTLVVSEGGPVRASAAGVLEFRIGAADVPSVIAYGD